MAGLLLGIWPLPLTDEITVCLQPAADLANEEIETGPGWTTWTIHDGEQLIGAAHVRRTVEHVAEVKYVGGIRAREWIGELDRLIGTWADREGCSALRAFGRRGWLPVLTRQGWRSERLEDGTMAYERSLGHG